MKIQNTDDSYSGDRFEAVQKYFRSCVDCKHLIQWLTRLSYPGTRSEMGESGDTEVCRGFAAASMGVCADKRNRRSADQRAPDALGWLADAGHAVRFEVWVLRSAKWNRFQLARGWSRRPVRSHSLWPRRCAWLATCRPPSSARTGASPDLSNPVCRRPGGGPKEPVGGAF